MKLLNRSLISLLIAVAVFLKIERLRLEDVKVIDLQPFVYALGIGAVLLTIMLPNLRRASVTATLALWTGAYFLCKVILFADEGHPLYGDIHIYLTTTEIAFVAILVLLARNVARDLHDFEEAVENITLGEIGRSIQKVEEATENIEVELMRSRRHHRPLAVIVVEPAPGSIKAALHRTVQEVQRAMMSRYVFTSLGRALGDAVRRTDIILVDTRRNQFVVFCPETDSKGSRELAERIQDFAAQRMGVKIDCGIGAFPDEALTFEELVRRAEARINNALTGPALPALASDDTVQKPDQANIVEKK